MFPKTLPSGILYFDIRIFAPTGKVGEVFDMSGLACSIVAEFKLDLSDLHPKYDWKNIISDSYRNIWIDNFDTMNDLDGVVWSRSVAPLMWSIGILS